MPEQPERHQQTETVDAAAVSRELLEHCIAAQELVGSALGSGESSGSAGYLLG